MSDERELRLGRDDEARRLAQSEFGQPLMVVAGAGTGKTSLLVTRIVSWLVGPGWQRHAEAGREPDEVARRAVERVVAITFTEAAAAEMAARVVEALEALADDELPVGWQETVDGGAVSAADRARRARVVLDEVHRLRAQTIHAFCQGLLAEHPLEAGLHPRFAVDADQHEVEDLVAEVVEGALRALEASGGGDDWRRLAGCGLGPADVAAGVRALVAAGIGAADLAGDPFDGVAAAAVAGRLRSAAAAFVAAGGGALVHPKTPRSAAAASALLDLGRFLAEDPTPPSFERLILRAAEVDAKDLDRFKTWASGGYGKIELALIGDTAGELAAAAAVVHAELRGLADLDPESHLAARRVLAPLLAEAREAMRVRGLVTYDDLLTGAARLLAGDPVLRRQLRASMDQLLVDEFQDTDAVQCRIVERLALGEGPGPGLFVVGDPKQSIYGFRRADLAAYDAFRERLAAAGGRELVLCRNFRSVRPILDEVERVVAPVMRAERGLQPSFEPLEATAERVGSPGFDRPPWSAVEHWLCLPLGDDGRTPVGKGRVADVLRLESEAVARDLRRLHDEAGMAWGEAALLLRSTTRQEELLGALRRAGVPHEVTRERQYYRQREVVEAAALVRTVLEPGDALALLTVVRSAVVGVPDAALTLLWDAGFPAAMARLAGPGPIQLDAALRLVETARRLLPRGAPGVEQVPHWPVALAAAVETVAVLREALESDPPDRWLERLRLLWLPEVAAAARYLGRFRVGRLQRFFDQLEGELLDAGPSRAVIARALRRAVEEGRDSQLPPEPDTAADAVQVMTLHGAKGLDFEHVYLLQMGREDGGEGAVGPQTTALPAADRVELELLGLASPGFASARETRAQRERAERVRLLYVAMTRAKQRLVLSGAPASPGARVEPSAAKRFDDLVAHRLDAGVVAAIADAEADPLDGRRGAVGNGVQLRLPALETAVEEVARPTAPAGGDDLARVQADARRLAEAGEAAGRRMARPLSGAASAAAHRRLGASAAEPAGREARDGAEEGSGPSPPPETAGDAEQAAATAAGTAVHRVLESLDLAAGGLREQVLAHREGVLAEVERDAGRRARERLAPVLDTLASGACLARLEILADRVLARELPLLLPPGEDDDALGVVTGAVDLVYSDPEDGRLVVADYKTDAVEDPDRLAERTAAYALQLDTYARALAAALALDEPPHRELWYLRADRAVRL